MVDACWLTFIDHTLRHDNENILLLSMVLIKKRRRGRPRTVLGDHIKETSGWTPGDIARLAQDQNSWRKLVRQAGEFSYCQTVLRCEPKET